MKNKLQNTNNIFSSLFLLLAVLFATPAMSQTNGSGGNPCNTSQPRPITGNQNPCPGTLETYCIDNDRGYTSFVWDVPRAQAGNPPTGWEIVSGQGTNCVTVRVGTKNGPMKVKVTDPICGTKVATLPVKPSSNCGSTPVCPIAATITGPELLCLFSDDAFTFDVDAVAGATYAWTITNATITFGQGTNSVEVMADIDAGPGSISVLITNSCGSKTVTMPFEVVEDCDLINPLPVELLSFTGTATAEGVSLNWATATEKDNDRFEVQRSADGRSFETVGTVKGNGNSNTRLNYNFQDKRPMAGINYYRLRQVDFSGTFEFSKVIAVDARNKMNDAVTLYPNPTVDGIFNVRMQPNGQEVTLQVMDISGRVLHTRNVTNNADVMVDGKALGMRPGMYLISVKSGENVTVQKLLMK